MTRLVILGVYQYLDWSAPYVTISSADTSVSLLRRVLMDYPSNAVDSWLLKWIVLPFGILLMIFLCISYSYGVHQCRSACKKLGYAKFTYAIHARFQETCACVTGTEKQPLVGVDLSR